MNIKAKKLIFFFVICVLISDINAEFKICATDKNSAECKKIEASRNDVKCVTVTDSVDCIFKIQKGEIDFGTFTPEESLLATNFLEGKADVVAEIRNPDRLDHEFAFQTVVVVKANYTGGLGALMNSAYCHPGFSRSQYWTDQVLKYFERKVLEFQPRALQCAEDKSAHENELFRLTQIFRKSCRPGPWTVNDWRDKRYKQTYNSLCSQCYNPPTCAYALQNKGDHHAALRCLTDGSGDVAYTALEFVQEYFNLGVDTYQSPHNASLYRFLCEDGTMKELTSRDVCAWVKQPWTAVVARKNVSANVSSHLKTWLPQDSSKLESWAVNLKNLVTKDRGEIRYLSISASLTDYVKRGRNIPQFETSPCKRTVRWCTINDKEQRKCEVLKTAAKTHGIPAELQCVSGNHKIVCLNKIKENKADIVFIDSDLGFTARKVYNLTTAAFLETERTGDYYGVIVVRKGTYSQFKDLKNKRACFPKYNGLGWLSFAHVVKNQSLVPSKLCSDSRMVWDFFSEACAPGASDPNLNNVPSMVPDKICARCKAVQHNGCKAEPGNPYYGEVGALRCLNNKDGDVAFLNFYAIKKFLNSDRHNTDDANIKLEDFSILCNDGSIADFNITDPEKCSVTQINGGEVVMRKNVNHAQKLDITETLLELDDWFGTTSRRYDPVLRMYEPFDGDNDVLFKESSVALVSAYETQNRFVNNYVQLLNAMENCYKESKASELISSAFLIFLSVLIILYDNN